MKKTVIMAMVAGVLWQEPGVLGIQVPFFKSSASPHLLTDKPPPIKSLTVASEIGDDARVHYSTLDPKDLPIDLSQYQDRLVVRVNYTGNQELKRYLLALKDEDIAIWSKASTVNTIDLQMSRTSLEKLVAMNDDLDFRVIIEDLPQAVFETFPKDHKQSINNIQSNPSSFKYKITQELKDLKALGFKAFSDLFFEDYRPFETINTWLELVQESFPHILDVQEIGRTFEDRPFNIVHLSSNIDDDHSHKKTIVVTGGVHAREWISVSSVCYQLYSLLEHYSRNPELFAELDFIFIPVLNPDGYEYSWNSDRLWRKNRQNTILPRCFGIDIDHAFDFHWSKSSDWPCGEEYSGETPFEATESQIWYDYLNRTNGDHKIYGYIDLHSYAQEILYPFAYSCEHEPRDEENLIELAYGISKAIRLRNGKYYSVLPACQDKDSDLIPDLGAGTSLDYMYHNQAWWAYQLKLRDSGNHGFLLPSKYIEPVGQEVFAGIEYFINFITDND